MRGTESLDSPCKRAMGVGHALRNGGYVVGNCIITAEKDIRAGRQSTASAPEHARCSITKSGLPHARQHC